MEDCIFCKIINGEIKNTNILHDDKDFIVIKDIKPKADVHFRSDEGHHAMTSNSLCRAVQRAAQSTQIWP